MSSPLTTRIEALLQLDIEEVELLQKLNGVVVEEKLKQKPLSVSQSIMTLFVQHKNTFLSPVQNPTLIKTGFSNIDKVIRGFLPGEYIVIGARPNNGLNLFLLQLACTISKEFPLLYISMGNTYPYLTARCVSVLAGIETHYLLKNQLTAKEKELIRTFEIELSELMLLINRDTGTTIFEFRLLCEKHVKEDGVKVILFDSLQLINAGFRSKNRRELEISFVNSELKKIARELNVCLIVGSHLSRSMEYRSGPEGKKPVLSDLRDSGSIEQEADKVLLLHSPESYKITEDSQGNSLIGKLEVLLVKDELGKSGEFIIKYNHNRTKLVELDYDAPPEFLFPGDRLSEITPPF